MKSLKFILDETLIEESFGMRNAIKGFDLFESGRVLNNLRVEVAKNEPALEIYGQVKGSRSLPYNVMLTIPLMVGDLMDARCSCPVGYDCKHGAALAYAILHLQRIGQFDPQNEGASPDSFDLLRDWLDRFEKALNQPDREPQKDYRLHYLFKPERDDLRLEIVRVKTLKSGKPSRGSVRDLGEFIHEHSRYMASDYLTPEDLEISRLLYTLVEEIGWGAYGLDWHDPLMSLAVKKMLATGRAHLPSKEWDRPLRWCDDPIDLDWRWRKKPKSDTHQLYPSIPIHRLMGDDPLLMLDENKGCIRPVRSPFEIRTVKLLNDLPPIDTADLSTFAAELVQRFPSLPLPLPKKAIEIERIETPPVPCLKLADQTATLTFDYAGYEVDADANHTSLRQARQGKIVEITLDTDTHRAAIESLEAAGLERIGAHFEPKAKDPQGRIEAWRRFLQEHRPRLQSQGWRIEEAQPQPQFHHPDRVVVEAEEEEHEGGMRWFELSFEVELEGEPIDLVEPIAALLHQYDSPDDLPENLNLPVDAHHYIHLKAQTIRPIVETLYQLFDRMKTDTIEVAPFDAHLIQALDSDNVVWKGAEELAELLRRLRDFKGVRPADAAPAFNGTLRSYQRYGLGWLEFLHAFGFGGILADDMGLGKTLQTLAFIQKLKHQKKLTHPVLIVVPTSLLGNWRLEADKFTPDLRVHTLYGTDRRSLYETLQDADIVLTTYAIAQRDATMLQEIAFDALILDEAQKIKNPAAKITRALKRFKAPFRLALTGTPMENHLGELWSIFDFLMPGFLGNHTFFKTYWQNPIEKQKSIERRERLQRKIAPFMLRRTKEEVLEELPEKIELVRSVAFGKQQAALYETIRIAMEKKVRDEIAAKGLARSHIMVLDALLKLRQVCCDPSLLDLPAAKKVKKSAKRELLKELLSELLAQDRKILLFSQFAKMLDLIEEDIQAMGVEYAKLTGQTRQRDKIIERFRTDKTCRIFLISLKAGGVGLNLVEADTVIHYDPWWNPAVENQATDRAHRIGQRKRVEVYKLIVENSVEEKILKLQEKKAALQQNIYRQKGESEAQLDGEMLLKLLKEA